MAQETEAPKVSHVNMRLSEADKAELRNLAEAEGLSMSEYIRKHLLSERVQVIGPKAKT